MKKQDYSNHARYYTPHHFVFYPVMLALFIAAIVLCLSGAGLHMVWMFICFLVIAVTALSFMLRQHYALTLQNRLVLMELRFRYYVVTQQRFEPLEAQLSFGQLAALRFAPDDELPALVQRALTEKLSPSDIKKSVRNWKADHRRV